MHVVEMQQFIQQSSLNLLNHTRLTTLTAQDDYIGYSLEEHRTRFRNVWTSEGKCMDMSKDLLHGDCLLEIQGHS